MRGKTASGAPKVNVLPGESFVSPYGIKTPQHLLRPLPRPEVSFLDSLNTVLQISINGDFEVFYSGVNH